MGNETRESAIILVEDTRNKPGHHKLKNEYFESQGIKVVRSKLPAADYSLLTDMSRVIDSKQNLQELVGNLTGSKKKVMKDGKKKVRSEHERFADEADFCKENGIEFIVLIEEPGMHVLEDVKRWYNPRLRKWKKDKWMGRKVNPKPPTDNITLFKIMYSFGKNHDVRWEFCSPQDAGRRVIELLTEGKNGKI